MFIVFFQLSLRTVNSSRSAYGSFLFFTLYFQQYDCGGEGDQCSEMDGEGMRCKINMKVGSVHTLVTVQCTLLLQFSALSCHCSMCTLATVQCIQCSLCGTRRIVDIC